MSQSRKRGPESPADLRWSQGAKNPRMETYTNDNKYTSDVRTSSGHSYHTKHDRHRTSHAIGTPSGDTFGGARATSSNYMSREGARGTQYGDTSARSSTPPRRDNSPVRKYNVDQHYYAAFLHNKKTDEENEKRLQLMNHIKDKNISDIFKNHKYVALIPLLGRESIWDVKRKIHIELIKNYYNEYRKDRVTIDRVTTKQGYVHVFCNDLFSLRWLQSTNIFYPFLYTKVDFSPTMNVAVTLPKGRFSRFKSEFIRLLIFQNREIDPSRWLLNSKEQREKTEVWIVHMDMVSANYIKSVGGKLFCGAGMVEFSV